MRRWAAALRLRSARAQEVPGFHVAVVGGLLGVATLVAATLGALELSPVQVASAIADADDPMHSVLWDVRLPRVVCGALVGAALATAGVLLQTVVRNPLADPGLLGVTAGAGLGALLLLIFFPELTEWVPVVAFVGGTVTVVGLLLLAWKPGQAIGPLRIVLSGVAVQAMLFALLSLLTFAYADRAPAFASFLVGSLNGLGWADALSVGVPTAIGLALAVIYLRPLDVLLLDDVSAGGLGLGVRSARIGVSGVAALLAAGAVSVAGLVGFVGLVVPNAVRVWAGPGHALLLPLSAVGGAALVLAADAAARTALRPLELPVGALLALIGGPYFLSLLWRKVA